MSAGYNKSPTFFMYGLLLGHLHGGCIDSQNQDRFSPPAELTRQVESAAVLSVYPEAEDTHRRTIAAIQRSINSIQADMAHLEGLSR